MKKGFQGQGGRFAPPGAGSSGRDSNPGGSRAGVCFCNDAALENVRLLNMKNVLITPHIAYNTKEAAHNILKITVENLKSSIKFTTGAKNLILL